MRRGTVRARVAAWNIQLLLLAVAGCVPTSAELVRGGQLSATARRSCLAASCDCGPAIRCSGAVSVMAAVGAGRSEVRAADASCAGIHEPAAMGRTFLGYDAIVDAIAQAARLAADRAREREATRLAVAAQSSADLAAELARAK